MQPLAIVTGVSPGGIGVHTTIGLLRNGFRVIIAGRDAVKASAAIALIHAQLGSAAPVEFMPCDLASLASIRGFVEVYTARYGRLNLLVNNAGLNTIGMVNPRTLDGFELAYGVNFIGPYYLTTLLLPLLRAGAPSRIVNVTSQMHRSASLSELPTAPTLQTARSYANSKLALVMLTTHLQQQFRAEGVDVRVFSVTPGAVSTEIWRNLPRCVRLPFSLFSRVAFLTPEQGAATSLYAALDPCLGGGQYISPYKGTHSYPQLFDYWSLFGGPRVCFSSPDSYNVKASRLLMLDTATRVADAVATKQ